MVENIILKNLSTSALLELDVTETPYYILDTVDWGQITASHHSYKYVNQVGVTVVSTTLETRDVEIVGWIIASTEQAMESRKKVLNRFVNPMQFINMQYKQYNLDFKPTTTIKYTASIEENNEVMCKFKINGLAADPLFRDVKESKETAANIISTFHFPLMINVEDNGLPTIMFGYKQPSLLINVYNKGDVKTGFRIVFKAKGTLVNPSLLNVSTQKYFKINKTMVAGEEIEVDTVTGEKRVVGRLNGEESNYYKYKDLSSTWLELQVGDNVFRYDADEGMENLEVYVYFSNRYLEVEGCY